VSTSLYPSNVLTTQSGKRVEKRETGSRAKLTLLCMLNVFEKRGRRRIEKKNTSKRYVRLVGFTVQCSQEAKLGRERDRGKEREERGCNFEGIELEQKRALWRGMR